MGLAGWLASRMLRIPMLTISHDDLPARTAGITGNDYRVCAAASAFYGWFCGQSKRVFSRSRFGNDLLVERGIQAENVATLPSVGQSRECQKSPACVWQQYKIRQPRQLVCSGAMSTQKDAQLIASAFRKLCKQRHDTALVVIGNGRWAKFLVHSLAAYPVYHVFPQGDGMQEILHSADLLLQADRADASGQIVLDAQMLGLPVLVGDGGAGREFMDDELTGVILPQDNVESWTSAMTRLLDDEPLRQRMSRTARQRSGRVTPARAWEMIWESALAAANHTDGDPAILRPEPRGKPVPA
jgi:glycosyltransferase involved in cell wall biosynthesis